MTLLFSNFYVSCLFGSQWLKKKKKNEERATRGGKEEEKRRLARGEWNTLYEN